MAQLMKLYNTYLGPASNLLLDIGHSSFYWNNGFIKTLNSDVLTISTGNFTILTATSSRMAGIVSTGMTVNSMNVASLRVGSGAFVTGIISSTYTLDFPSTAAFSSTDLTVGLAGVVTNDTVMLGIPSIAISSGSNCDNCMFSAWVVSNNAVSIRFLNGNAVLAADAASGIFRITVIRI